MSTTRDIALAGIIGLMLTTGAALAAGPVTPKPDPKKGRELAERVCSTCHIVSEQATSGAVTADVPSFAAIADKPDQSLERLAGRIVIPHPPMPAIALTREEIVNVVSYIMTLKGHAAP
jgi:cytochrome c